MLEHDAFVPEEMRILSRGCGERAPKRRRVLDCAQEDFVVPDAERYARATLCEVLSKPTDASGPIGIETVVQDNDAVSV
jgi:hypothetical protein